MIALCDELDAGLRLGGEQVGQRQGAADQRAADGEEVAAGQAVAEAALAVRLAEDRQHERPPFRNRSNQLF